MADSIVKFDKPRQIDLDRCVHCGLCLNACPTYRELGVEMDSPRGRIYQMNQVAAGAPIGPSYIEHMELCLACRACETACPSGVEYGRLIEAARADIETRTIRPLRIRLLRKFVFGHLLQSPRLLKTAGALLYLYQVSGLQKVARSSGLLRLFGKLGRLESLAPPAESPFFFAQIGKTFPAEGERRYRVAFLAGCIANVSFARLNDATVRVLQKNGCEVVVPAAQTCCGALHVHAGLREEARKLARRNIDAVVEGGFDAVITNAAGCGSTLKEYDELLEHDPAYAEKARQFIALMKDVNEFLASIELNLRMGEVAITATYQDSCHLAHGQRVRTQPRKLLRSVPGLKFREMPMADLCCGSAGIYNVIQNDMAMTVLKSKMDYVNMTGADVIVTANPGCMLQLQAGNRLHGKCQRVAHVVEILDEAYRKFNAPEELRMKPFIAAIFIAMVLVYAQPSGDPLIEGFRLVEAASVADAIEQLYGQRAHMSHEMRPLFTTKFAGPAVTVLLKKQEHKDGAPASQGMLDAIDNAPAGSVYVIVAPDGGDVAGIGGLMATAMKVRGLAGAVVDASIRDTPQIKRLQFPVFSRGIAPSTSINHYRFAGANVPVTCAGMRVNPNDIIVADEDGVVVVPRAKAADVLKKAQELDDTEHKMLPFIEKFRSIKQAVEKFGRI